MWDQHRNESGPEPKKNHIPLETVVNDTITCIVHNGVVVNFVKGVALGVSVETIYRLLEPFLVSVATGSFPTIDVFCVGVPILSKDYNELRVYIKNSTYDNLWHTHIIRIVGQLKVMNGSVVVEEPDD